MPQSEFWPFTRNRVPNDELDPDSSVMQKQLGDMEGQVKEIQMELAAIKRNRMDLVAQKKIETAPKEPGNIAVTVTAPSNQTCRNDEQEITEVSKLREELIVAKNFADEERVKREKYERKLKELELKLCNIYHTGILTDTKDSRKITEEEFNSVKKQLRDAKENLEEMDFIVNEKTEEIREYRAKYLQAQQHVEELKRQLDVVENDNKQVSDQLQIEIQRMKFQEKLQELAPLPDLLKGAQLQLEEAKRFQKLAEETSEQLSKELLNVKEKLVVTVNNYNQEKIQHENVLAENMNYKTDIEHKAKEIDDRTKIIDEFKCQLLRLEEKLGQQEILYNEKSSECARLMEDLNDAREEKERSAKRHKERSESMRRYFQTHVVDLERQLTYSRAQCKAAQKEKEEIRQRVQSQVNNLQENFELVNLRLRGLLSQVTSTMHASLLLNDNDEIDENFNVMYNAR